MEHSKVLTKILSVLLTFLFIFVTNASIYGIIAEASPHGDNYESMSSEEKQAYLEQKIKEYNAILSSLGKQSSDTEAYVNTLNDKIGFMQKELDLAESTIESSLEKQKDLKKQFSDNQEEIEQLKVDISNLEVKEKEVQKEFDKSYGRYAQRARALYISGGTNVLEMLLTCDDLSTLFTRLEMVKRISKYDEKILSSLKTEGEELLSTKKSLDTKRTDLTSTQENLKVTQANLEDTIKILQVQQANYNEKQKSYKTEKNQADKLLQELHKKKNTYSEYRNEDQKELMKINKEIEDAGSSWVDKQEQTTTTTTQKPTHTTKPSGDDTTKPTTKPSSKLSLTYPVPSHKKITTAYGSAGYVGHTGVDFACPSGSKVVAAEDGEVIISKDLTNSDGSYRSYGRYIVIAHYKKNSSGNYVFTLYAHNSQRKVSEGDKVKKGQLIAYSGSTGNSSGPHCHFEVRTPTSSYDDCVDPTPYLP